MIEQTPTDPFGEVLRSFRKRRRLSQQALADALGVHRNTIGRWEEGSFLPESKTMILELARHLALNDRETRLLLEASLTVLTSYWLVPLPRNPYFTGREEILEALHTQLGINQAVALAQSSALHGLGGVGKTQIALEYAYRHSLEYSAIFWIGAETDESTVASLLHMAEVLQLPERDNKDQQRVVTAVQHWLSAHGQWLLIWDNVEDLALLNRFLPSTRSGAILITTRSQTLGTFARGLDLLPMGQEEGMLFLLRRAKMLEPEATSEHIHQLAQRMPLQYEATAELVTAMGGLPLALDQAGAYLEETRCGLTAYLKTFRTQRAALLQQRGAGSREHPASVSTTFTLAITATAQSRPAVRDLLRVCALLQPDAIPEELFYQGAEHLGTTLEAVCCNTLDWNQVVAAACGYSLLSRQAEEQTFSMHRLVQVILLDAMTETERKEWTWRVIRALDAIFPEVLPMTEYAVWNWCERLLPHALLCLHRVGTAEESLAFASLAYKTAQYLRERGRYAEAKPLFLRALRLQEQILGPDHPDVALTLNYLAILYRRQGKYTEAEPLFQRALHIREQALGPDHPDVALTLGNLAGLRWLRGRYAEAETFYQQALHISEQSLGPDHSQVAQVLTSLAGLCVVQGKYAEAEPLFQRAVLIYKQSLGPDHPQAAQVLTNLAGLYRDQGRYVEAEALFQQALHIREQSLGPDHLDVAVTLVNLALLYQERGNYAKAEPLFQRTVYLREQGLGPDHPDVALPLADLAGLYREQGRYVEAEALFQRALHISEQRLGPDHPNVAVTLNDLAILYREQGNYTKAEALFQRARSIREQYLGRRHPETAQTLHDLAVLRQKQGKLSESISLAEHALSIRSQALEDAHPKTVATRTLYTQLIQQQEDIEKAMLSQQLESPSHSLQEPVDSSLSENDPLQAFLDTCCELHPRAWCRISDLWQAYEQWIGDHQERFPLSRRAFAAQVKTRGCYADRTNTTRIWRGITLVKREP